MRAPLLVELLAQAAIAQPGTNTRAWRGLSEVIFRQPCSAVRLELSSKLSQVATEASGSGRLIFRVAGRVVLAMARAVARRCSRVARAMAARASSRGEVFGWSGRRLAKFRP